MDKRNAAILVALALVLGTAGLFVHQRSHSYSAPRTTGGKFLPAFDPNAVAKVTIQSPEGSLVLEKTGDVWSVTSRSYPADFDAIARLIRTLWDLQAVQDVRAGKSQFGRLDLLEPGHDHAGAGTLIDLQDANGSRVAAIVLGKNSFANPNDETGMAGFPNGRFVVAAGTDGPVGLVTETFQNVVPQPENWLNREFVRPENIQAISATGSTPTEAWSAIRLDPASPWQLADAKPGETLTGNLPSSLPALSIADVKPEPAPLTNPRESVVRTFDGFVYRFEFGPDEAGRLPVRVHVDADIPGNRSPAAEETPEEKERLDKEFAARQTALQEKLANEKKFEGRTFLIDPFTVDALVRPRSAIVSQPQPTPTPSPTPRRKKNQ